MKRTITTVFSIALAFVMVLSLAACGGNGEGNGTSEKAESTVSKLDADNAIVETPAHICKDAKDNQAKVKQNTYIMSCTIGEVNESYFTCAESAASTELRVCLDTNSLVNLNKGDKIAIIGKITNFEEGNYGMVYAIMGEAEKYNGTVSEVAPRDDEIFTGKLTAQYSSYNKWEIICNGTHDITFATGEDVSKLKIGYKVTFSCDDYTGGSFDDAKIIKVN